MKITFLVDMDSGGAAVMYAAGFIALCCLSKWVPALATALVGALGLWTAGLGEYLLKRHGKDKVSVERLKVDGGSGA